MKSNKPRRALSQEIISLKYFMNVMKSGIGFYQNEKQRRLRIKRLKQLLRKISPKEWTYRNWNGKATAYSKMLVRQKLFWLSYMLSCVVSWLMLLPIQKVICFVRYTDDRNDYYLSMAASVWEESKTRACGIVTGHNSGSKNQETTFRTPKGIGYQGADDCVYELWDQAYTEWRFKKHLAEEAKTLSAIS